MATATKTQKFAVMLAIQGNQPQIVMVGSGATVRSALSAAKQEPEKLAGAITLNGKNADLADRVTKGAYLAVTPKVAGGSR